MKGFNWYTVPRVCFGAGQLARLGELAAPLGQRALVIYNGGGDAAERAAALLRESGIHADLLRQRGEPTLDDIDRATNACRASGAEFLIGMGGGSAMDAAKAAAGLAVNPGAALDYLEVIGAGKPLSRTPLPWIAIPATAGSGAEATRNAVISSPAHQYKASLRSEKILAKIALIDPEVGVNVPPSTTAASGMDALCQLIESYTSTGANPMTDALACEGMTRVADALEDAFEDGQNLWARTEMALGALFGGICLTNAGLGAVHGFAAPLGARFPIPHGVICAILLPHVMAANVQAVWRSYNDSAVDRYATVGGLLTGDLTRTGRKSIEAGIEWITNLVKTLGIGTLADHGFDASNIEEIVPLAKKASSMRFNPVTLSDAKLAGILRAAM